MICGLLNTGPTREERRGASGKLPLHVRRLPTYQGRVHGEDDRRPQLEVLHDVVHSLPEGNTRLGPLRRRTQRRVSDNLRLREGVDPVVLCAAPREPEGGGGNVPRRQVRPHDEGVAALGQKGRVVRGVIASGDDPGARAEGLVFHQALDVGLPLPVLERGVRPPPARNRSGRATRIERYQILGCTRSTAVSGVGGSGLAATGVAPRKHALLIAWD
mmetsp:Transcript_42013/g.82385  ORF Transcript_42013/g.82385 Transcript_42013/m.82385 type:complete len:216 (-) Transcript_42013:87-734(-)